MERFSIIRIVNCDSSGIDPPIVVARFSKNRILNRDSSGIVPPLEVREDIGPFGRFRRSLLLSIELSREKSGAAAFAKEF